MRKEYIQVINGEVNGTPIDTLPTSFKNGDQWISGFNQLSDKELAKYGFYLIVDTPPEFDDETQILRQTEQYTIDNEKKTVSYIYEVIDKPVPEHSAPEPENINLVDLTFIRSNLVKVKDI